MGRRGRERMGRRGRERMGRRARVHRNETNWHSLFPHLVTGQRLRNWGAYPNKMVVGMSKLPSRLHTL